MAQDSLFTASDKPASLESDQAVTVGLVFRSKVEGFITHVRVYKSTAADNSTYALSIWTATGEQLTTQTYQAAGPAGWKRVALEQPVRIEPNVNYLASVFLPLGKYGSRANMFTADRVRGNLTAPASARAGGNNRYKYAPDQSFPTATYRNTSYYVDVVFKPRSPLIVNAGKDSTYTMPIDTVRLAGRVTGDEAVFSWNMEDSLTFPYYPEDTVVMHDSRTLTPYIVGMREGIFTYSLTAWDLYGSQSRHYVRITVQANPKDVIFELLRDGTWRVVDEKKFFLLKTSQ